MPEYRGLILPDAPQPERKASGVILMDDGDGKGEVEVATTMRCAHGGEHFISVKGSGITRGWCSRCHGVFCGIRHAHCYPWQKQIDDYEKGKLIVLGG